MKTRLILKRHHVRNGRLILEVWVLAGCISIELSGEVDGSATGKWLQEDSICTTGHGQGPGDAFHQFLPDDADAYRFIAELLYLLDFNHGRRQCAEAA